MYERFNTPNDEPSDTFGSSDPPKQDLHLRQKAKNLFYDLETLSADFHKPSNAH